MASETTNVDINSESKIDINGAVGIIDTLTAAANQFNSNIPLCSNCPDISILAEAGFDTSSCATYDAGIKELASKLVNVSSSIKAYADSVHDADKIIEDEIPEEEPEKVEEEVAPAVEEITTAEVEDNSMENLEKEAEEIDSGSNNDGSSGEATITTNIGSKTELEKPKNPSSKPNTDLILNECEKYYSKISPEVLQSILSDLYAETMKNNLSLVELLSNDKYSNVVLAIINKNNKIDSNIVKNMNSLGMDITRKLLYKSLLGEKNILGITKESVLEFKTILIEQTKSKNLKLEDLIKNNDKQLVESVALVRDALKDKYNSNTYKLANIMSYLDNKKISYMISELLR